ncbi:MAG TPA: hypothetical protein VM581_02715 [Magnetospirillaceae bacterium]|nr:hypothetical protein [Magnetospirillaceae bacterium]
MMIFKKQGSLLRLSGLVVLSATLISLALPTLSRAESGQAFSISPPVIELKADPGQTVNATIKFTNISSGELLIKTQFNDFGAKDENGDPNIIFDDEQNSAYTLKNWIGTSTPFKIAGKETKTLTFPINVPRDAEPGGHYAVIRFTGISPELEESGVALSASIGSLVLLEVSGNIEEHASLSDFYSATQTAKTGFFESAPITFIQRINNTGNVHIKPTGTVDIYDIFGRKVNSLRVNGDPTDPKNQPRSALPQSVRRFEQSLDDQWMIGRYTAKIHLTYGQGQQALDSEVSFWVIPYKLITGGIIGLIAVFFALRWAIKRYNAHIIKQARKNKRLR